MKTVFIFLFFFSLLPWVSQAMYMPGNLCLHPLETAALLHGKAKPKSLSSRIKGLEKKIERLEEKIENREDEIAKLEDSLANVIGNGNYTALNTKEDKDGTAEDAAWLIKEYMKQAQDREVNSWKDMGTRQGDINPQKAPWAEETGMFTKRGVKGNSFCKQEYVSDSKECEDILEDLEKELERLAMFEEQKESFEEQHGELEGLSSDIESGLVEETEASPFCFECLEELRDLDGPTTGQVVGNALSILAGGAISYYGYEAGKDEARALNNLRVRQGYDPISSSGLSWAGASMGLPFISNGVHGLAGGHSRFGSFACSPSSANRAGMYSPFQFGAGGGLYGGGNPWASAGGGFQFGGGNPFGSPFGGANAGFQFGGGNPFGSPFGGSPFGGANASFQFGGGNPFGSPFGGNPSMGANAGFQFGGGNPFGGNPFMGANAGFQFGGGNPFGGNPFMGANAGFQFGGGGMMNCMAIGCPTGNPFGARAGFQFGRQGQYAQYLQFQQQQMEFRIKMQQSWLQHQQSVQKDWMQRQQVIGSLTQEIYRIQQQIQLVSSGGVAGNSILGANTGSLNTGLDLGGNTPQHTPAPTPTPTTSGKKDEVPLILER